MSCNFAMTGVAGYVAPRHLEAIKATGNRLVAASDPHDSVGILDRYFPDVAYFREFERFDRHVEKLRRGPAAERVNYVSICSPNYLHDAHIRFALRIGADAICEKPLVINPWNLDVLQDLERETGRRVHAVLQLRVHPAVVALKQRLEHSRRRHRVKLSYVTARGPWYRYSWKGNPAQSGGLAANIGIHFFDMLLWIFGEVEGQDVDDWGPTRTSGRLVLARADVEWLLSVDAADLPDATRELGQSTFRSITVDDEQIEFSGGFSDLHTEVYRRALSGCGYGIRDARPAIELVYQLRRDPGRPHPGKRG